MRLDHNNAAALRFLEWRIEHVEPLENARLGSGVRCFSPGSRRIAVLVARVAERCRDQQQGGTHGALTARRLQSLREFAGAFQAGNDHVDR